MWKVLFTCSFFRGQTHRPPPPEKKKRLWRNLFFQIPDKAQESVIECHQEPSIPVPETVKRSEHTHFLAGHPCRHQQGQPLSICFSIAPAKTEGVACATLCPLPVCVCVCVCVCVHEHFPVKGMEVPPSSKRETAPQRPQNNPRAFSAQSGC